MADQSPLRIAVLINTPPGNEFWNDVRGSYQDAFDVIAPNAKVNMYDPVFEGNFPNPQEYDLIVLSGGKADASSSEPWVLGVLDFLRRTARESPKTKILGICWSHQAISRAFGGEVRAVPTGPIAGLEDVKLTEAGMKFFSTRSGVKTYAHPEVQTELAKKMLLEEDDVYNGNLSDRELQDQLAKLERPTDGFEVLRRVIEWVRE
ncbi:hypothetical protein AtubIFM56815_001524 [Aspergillus tubingensis]|uniref:Glutamine amidotransferase domain-containing protein n=1 Tax=Aspergillus tubingensis TaxID=5068 RepID=A0A9W6AGE6_ASPTU|nr:hypothetical protein AtubIFM56815_001524 [Aspergillus tubingensis]GLA93977.1 hypothetical protein AtubIFM57143_000835 [Aspergillus tubingensis]